MAVQLQNSVRNIPEFRRPASSRNRTTTNRFIGPARRMRPATDFSTARKIQSRKGSMAGRALRSRLLDDLCAVTVCACGILFIVAIARMFLVA